jgi:GntP family permease
MLSKALADIIWNGAKSPPMTQTVLDFIGEPLVALTLAVLLAMVTFGYAVGLDGKKISSRIGASVGPVAVVILIVGAGGGFKQTLIGAGVGDSVAKFANGTHLSILLLGYLVAVALRLATGSATVATIAAAGIVAPLAGSLSPSHDAQLALAIGAGSLFLSHVSDAGFRLVKESFGPRGKSVARVAWRACPAPRRGRPPSPRSTSSSDRDDRRRGVAARPETLDRGPHRSLRDVQSVGADESCLSRCWCCGAAVAQSGLKSAEGGSRAEGIGVGDGGNVKERHAVVQPERRVLQLARIVGREFGEHGSDEPLVLIRTLGLGLVSNDRCMLHVVSSVSGWRCKLPGDRRARRFSGGSWSRPDTRVPGGGIFISEYRVPTGG